MKKFLLTIFNFDEGPVIYSVQSLSIENESLADFGGGESWERRKMTSRPSTLLQMYRDEYPVGMGFTFMENSNTLYFIGGQFNRDGIIYSSKKVFSVDLSSLVAMADDSSISISSPSSSFTSSPFTSSSSSSSSLPSPPFSFVSWLTVNEAPSMHVGKCNPIIIDAYGKIYVLASACGMYYNANWNSSVSDFFCDPNPKRFGPPPFHDDQHMTRVQLWENPQNIFEVFDPQSQKWSVLPDPSPDDYSAAFSPTVIVGQAVVNGMIILCDQSCNLLVYHIDNRQWAYFDSDSLPKPLYPHFYHFQMSHLIKNGIHGKGVVVDDTTLFIFNLRVDGISAYDSTSHSTYNSNSDSDSFIQVSGSKFPYSDKYDFPGGLMLSGMHLVNLGQGSLCALSCDYGCEVQPVTGDFSLTFFKVSEEPYSFGTSFWRANVKDSYLIEDMNTRLGSMLYCFALGDQISENEKLVERSTCSTRYGLLSTLRKTKWEGGLFAASAFMFGLGVLFAAAYQRGNAKMTL